MVEQGRGSAPDLPTAAELYHGAALQGFGPAENNYGVMLAEGRGVKAPDPVEGFAWVSLAVESGMPPTARDFFAARLDPTRMEEARARIAVLRERTPTATAPSNGNAQSLSVDSGLRDRIERLQRELESALSAEEESERHAANLEAQVQAVRAAEHGIGDLEATVRDLQAANARLTSEVKDKILQIAILNGQLDQAAAVLRKQGENLPNVIGSGR